HGATAPITPNWVVEAIPSPQWVAISILRISAARRAVAPGGCPDDGPAMAPSHCPNSFWEKPRIVRLILQNPKEVKIDGSFQDSHALRTYPALRRRLFPARPEHGARAAAGAV